MDYTDYSNNTHFLGYKTVVYKAHYAVGCNIVAGADNTVAAVDDIDSAVPAETASAVVVDDNTVADIADNAFAVADNTAVAGLDSTFVADSRNTATNIFRIKEN